MTEVSISAFAANQRNIEKDIVSLQKNGADRIHVDIMDGLFVPLTGLTSDWLDRVLEIINIPIDVHIMSVNNYSYIEALLNYPIDSIVFHIETENDLNIIFLLNSIKERKIRCGLAISPETDIHKLEPFISNIDEVLIMSTLPGINGSTFLSDSYNRIQIINNIRKQKNEKVSISVDSALKLEHVKKRIQNGANKLVFGREYFKQPDPKSFISKIQNISNLLRKSSPN